MPAVMHMLKNLLPKQWLMPVWQEKLLRRPER